MSVTLPQKHCPILQTLFWLGLAPAKADVSLKRSDTGMSSKEREVWVSGARGVEWAGKMGTEVWDSWAGLGRCQDSGFY